MPAAASFSTRVMTAPASLLSTASSSSAVSSPLPAPVMSSTSSYVSVSAADMHLSAMDSVSRTLPSPSRAMCMIALSSAFTPSLAKMSLTSANSLSVATSRKSNRMHRESMVAGSLWTSVVQSTNTTCAGGSSSVLSKALNALPESICTSSII